MVNKQSSKARTSDCLEDLEQDAHAVILQIEALDARLVAGPGSAAPIDRVLDLLIQQVLPHLHAEEAVLFPAVEDALQQPEATTALRVQHAELMRLVEELGMLSNNAQPERLHGAEMGRFHRNLDALRGLLSRHLQEERAVCGRALCDTLGPDEIAGLLRAMAEAEERARQDIVLVALPWRDPTEAVALRPNPRATQPLVFRLVDLERKLKEGEI
ncbi:MAG: hypothetical protein DLM67_04715 [Candidatus Nephthysia bennettiae]|nr:MAG: hypothetical protein DLM67_04715 [Candidatus Dormibacteraeota bacterium]